MSHITVQQLKELRQRTGAGMLDCRQALEQAGGNMEQAIEHQDVEAARHSTMHHMSSVLHDLSMSALADSTHDD